jgi:hypothetical protein
MIWKLVWPPTREEKKFIIFLCLTVFLCVLLFGFEGTYSIMWEVFFVIIFGAGFLAMVALIISVFFRFLR